MCYRSPYVQSTESIAEKGLLLTDPALSVEIAKEIAVGKQERGTE